MAYEATRLQVGIVAEAANARAEDGRADQSGEASRHVHDARARKIDHTTQPTCLSVSIHRAQKSDGVPRPVDDDRIDEAGDGGRVDEVGSQLAPLRHSP